MHPRRICIGTEERAPFLALFRSPCSLLVKNYKIPRAIRKNCPGEKKELEAGEIVFALENPNPRVVIHGGRDKEETKGGRKGKKYRAGTGREFFLLSFVPASHPFGGIVTVMSERSALRRERERERRFSSLFANSGYEQQRGDERQLKRGMTGVAACADAGG